MFALFAIAALCGIAAIAWPRARAWYRTKRTRHAMESQYRIKLAAREGIKYHADWARERGDFAEEATLRREVQRADCELSEMQDAYDELLRGGKSM